VPGDFNDARFTDKGVTSRFTCKTAATGSKPTGRTEQIF
jgi:hypothetical protein